MNEKEYKNRHDNNDVIPKHSYAVTLLNSNICMNYNGAAARQYAY